MREDTSSKMSFDTGSDDIPTRLEVVHKRLVANDH